MGMGNSGGGDFWSFLASLQQQQQPAVGTGPSAQPAPAQPMEPALEAPVAQPAPGLPQQPLAPTTPFQRQPGLSDELFSRANPRAAAGLNPGDEVSTQPVPPTDGGLWAPDPEPEAPAVDPREAERQRMARQWSQNQMFEGYNPFSGKWGYGQGK